MPRSHSNPEPPACYAMVIPGLEPVAAEEIESELGGQVKKSSPGLLVFRLREIDPAVLRLRTTEDIFLLGWGTDKLTYRAEDLDRIQGWTAREVDWSRLLRIHHAIRPKPKGKPTYHLVAQMSGVHGYRRVDARDALARGLAGKLPASWRLAEENAAVEIWLTIHGSSAVCGLRLSDRTMRHRQYKAEHLPASLRPTLAAALIRLADARPGHVVLDPMCGAGTILAEQREQARQANVGSLQLWGGDLDLRALRAARDNLRRLGSVALMRWDAVRLPLTSSSVDRVVSNPPFGMQLGLADEVGRLYQRMLPEYHRVLRPGGRAVLLVSNPGPLAAAAHAVGWKAGRALRVRILGLKAFITVWQKPS